MPRVTEREVDGFSWCAALNEEETEFCDPNDKGEPIQRPAVLIETLAETLYSDFDAGSELHGGGNSGQTTESSRTYYRLRDEVPCEKCGSQLQCSPQKRPLYLNLSGRDPRELRTRSWTQRLERLQESSSDDVSELKEVIAEQSKQISTLVGVLTQQAAQPRRRPAPKAEVTADE